MKRIFAVLAAILACAYVHASDSLKVRVGAEVLASDPGLLEGKSIALYCNHTAVCNGVHTLDLLLSKGLDIKYILAPEHGFRGDADAGAHVSSSVDSKTGIPIVSLYGKGAMSNMRSAVSDVDVVVTDIQDVGARFYTYHITMIQLMETAFSLGKEFVVLDRPNPHGMHVDGPLLEKDFRSGVGRLPIPVIHGLTMGEIATMAIGENWLENCDSERASLSVIPCSGYSHSMHWTLDIAPSPNLKDMTAIWLYPSTCLFEGTRISLGRGTEWPFCIYGHPAFPVGGFSFTPQSVPGATNPPLLGKCCYGVDLRGMQENDILAEGFKLDYVIDAFGKWVDSGAGEPEQFFTPFFDKLMGNSKVRIMILNGMDATSISATWQDELEEFKLLRRQYLLYPED